MLRARDALETMPSKLTGRPLDPKTINLTLGKVACAWRWAFERELVRVPWPEVRKLPATRTKKRPFTDEEVALVLDWLVTHQDGFWLPFFQVLADTGARVGQLCGLDGRDVDREQCLLTFRHANKVRGNRDAIKQARLPAETMSLVPEVGRDEPVFVGSMLRERVTRDGARYVLHKATKAVGIADHERLDHASFRRGWVTAAHREGIPADVARQQTGHSNLAVHLGYMANAQGDDLGEVVERVAARRARHRAPSASQEPGPASRGKPMEIALVGDQGAVSGSSRTRSS